eukprot:scaffold14196_cov27-Cyclotella_meneghiniana.AAC.3
MDELKSIIDANLNPVLERATTTILPSAFIDNIKLNIVSKTEAKVNVVKVPSLGAIYEVNGDGSILTGGSTFYDVATSLEAIKGRGGLYFGQC